MIAEVTQLKPSCRKASLLWLLYYQGCTKIVQPADVCWNALFKAEHRTPQSIQRLEGHIPIFSTFFPGFTFMLRNILAHNIGGKCGLDCMIEKYGLFADVYGRTPTCKVCC